MVLRILIVNLNNATMFTSVQHFTLTTVAIAMALQPVFNFVFGMIILGETKAKYLDGICLLLSMIGVLTMILAAVNNEEEVGAKKEYTWFYVLVLIFLPFCKSMG